MRALVVDDNGAVCAAICAVLRHAGLTATAAGSSREAVALLARGDFDVVLIDRRKEYRRHAVEIGWT
jgi:CheY-like chemotaxis protein